MTQQWTFYILLSTFLLNSPSNAAEDLLDQYVKHVENVNRIKLEPHDNLGHKKVAPLRTSYYRRSLKSVQDSEERTNEQGMPTALKTNESDSAVLAREHRDEVEAQHPKSKVHKHNNGHRKGSKQELNTTNEQVASSLNDTDSSVLANKHGGDQGRNRTHKHKHGTRKGFRQESEGANIRQELSTKNANESRPILAQKTSHKHNKGTKLKTKVNSRPTVLDESGLIPLKFDETDNRNQKQSRKHKKSEVKNVSNEGQLLPTNASLYDQNSATPIPKLHNHKKGSKGKGKSKDQSNNNPFTSKASISDPVETQGTEKQSRKHKKISGQKHATNNKVNISETLLPSMPPTQKHRGGSKQRGKHARKHNSRHRSRSRRSVLADDFSDRELRERRDVTSDILWTHSETLDKGGLVVLKWQPRHQEILFRVEARTRGYVAIGFSPDGKMENADMVMGWVDDRRNQPFLL
ncbi:unnamed protein product, partial [Callosobruchus maculatus]